MNTANKYIVYARKSSESEDRQIQSLGDQVSSLNQLAAIKGLHVVEILEESKSAKQPDNREVFNSMIKRIEKGEIQGILVWSMNRLFRNPVDQGRVGWLLQTGKLKEIHTVDRVYLPSDNVLLFNVEGGMANQYILDLSKMVKRGLKSKVEKGWRPGLPPVGYKNHKENGTIVPDEARFHIVRKMWDLMLTGTYSARRIAEIANTEWNFKTPTYKRMGGKHLCHSAIYRIFSNIFYTGMFEYSGNLHVGAHKPMITMDEFEKVQQLLGTKEKQLPYSNQHAYTSIINCTVCNGKYSVTQKRKYIKATDSYQLYTYYHCSRKGDKRNCNIDVQKPLTKRDLEKQISEIVYSFALDKDIVDWANEVLRKAKGTPTLEDNTVILKESITQAKKSLHNLYRLAYNKDIDPEFLEMEERGLKKQIFKLEAEINNAKIIKPKNTISYQDAGIGLNLYYLNTIKRGKPQEKSLILKSIGSNWRIEGKKLYFTKHKWVNALENLRSLYHSEDDCFEPTKSLITKGQKPNSDLLCPTLRSIIESFEKSFYEEHENTLTESYLKVREQYTELDNTEVNPNHPDNEYYKTDGE